MSKLLLQGHMRESRQRLISPDLAIASNPLHPWAQKVAAVSDKGCKPGVEIHLISPNRFEYELSAKPHSNHIFSLEVVQRRHELICHEPLQRAQSTPQDAP